MINWGGMILYMALQKGTNTYVHLHQPKKWLQEAKAQGSKIKSKGLDLFWLNTCGWSSKVGPTGKKSHHQANHPLIGHDGTNSRILCQRAPKLQNTCFFAENTVVLAKGYNHICSASPTKKRWLEEAEAQVSKIKPKGLDLFLTEYLRMISKGWPTGKTSLLQANHPQIGHDGTNSRILCQRAPKLQNICFLVKMHLSLQKGTTTYVQLHQPTCGQVAKQAFFPEDTFVHAKGLHIAVGICRTALVKPWTLKNCELSAGKSGARNSFFSVSDWGGEDMACYQRKHPGNNFFLDITGVNLLDVGRWAPGN